MCSGKLQEFAQSYIEAVKYPSLSSSHLLMADLKAAADVQCADFCDIVAVPTSGQH